MGGLAIEKIRDGVEFVPDAAAAFRRAEAQVLQELGRHIDCNSTYRSWGKQLSMYDAWNAYAGGWGPYPGHSKAVHPSESFHVSGLAVDSDDWRNARIVQILAENGFIRNRLYVPNEQHHFEYIRSRDKNHGKPVPDRSAATAIQSEEDDMKDKYCWSRTGGTIINAIYNTLSGYFQEFESNDGAYNTAKAQGHDVAGPTFEVSESDFRSIKNACAAVRTGKS